MRMINRFGFSRFGSWVKRVPVPLVLAVAALGSQSVRAEDGYELWLRYNRLSDQVVLEQLQNTLKEIVVSGHSPTAVAAGKELQTGLRGLLGEDLPLSSKATRSGALVLAGPEDASITRVLGLDRELDELETGGYLLRGPVVISGRRATVIASRTEIGLLYGSFHLLRLIQTQRPIGKLDVSSGPRIRHRLLDHWDNLDGSISRGYAGKSLWKWDELPATISPRLIDYARANASIGINGAVLNDVNADPLILTTDYLRKVAAIAKCFRPYGIRVFLSLHLGAPMPPTGDRSKGVKTGGGIGDLPTADLLDPRVKAWWAAKTDEIYRLIPDFGGWLVKADSESMPGPRKYGRSISEAANVLADIIGPHGGVVIWRAFVYPETADPDRAKRSCLEFTPLDGQFRSNVIVQVKNGPLDFQPREPFHPLFGGMPKTSLMVELQITQEYLGHATHLVYLGLEWQRVLQSDTHVSGPGSMVARLLTGGLAGQAAGGIAGVANVGDVRNWCGHPFAQANWYAFGRLAWDPDLRADAIAEEWTRMTWTNDEGAVRKIVGMMIGSWPACVDYMTPLGLNYLCEKGPHYDPKPASRVDLYWRCDRTGIGFDRSSRGSNAVGQYHEPLRSQWDDIERCPEEDLLWFHFVPWDRRMASGRDLWSELCYKYDRGVRFVGQMQQQWDSLEDKVDQERFELVARLLKEQAAHARIWRDTCVGFFSSRNGRPIPSNVSARRQSNGLRKELLDD
jgi:alpha-glucuronidase